MPLIPHLRFDLDLGFSQRAESTGGTRERTGFDWSRSASPRGTRDWRTWEPHRLKVRSRPKTKQKIGEGKKTLSSSLHRSDPSLSLNNVTFFILNRIEII